MTSVQGPFCKKLHTDPQLGSEGFKDKDFYVLVHTHQHKHSFDIAITDGQQAWSGQGKYRVCACVCQEAKQEPNYVLVACCCNRSWCAVSATSLQRSQHPLATTPMSRTDPQAGFAAKYRLAVTHTVDSCLLVAFLTLCCTFS